MPRTVTAPPKLAGLPATDCMHCDSQHYTREYSDDMVVFCDACDKGTHVGCWLKFTESNERLEEAELREKDWYCTAVRGSSRNAAEALVGTVFPPRPQASS